FPGPTPSETADRNEGTRSRTHCRYGQRSRRGHPRASSLAGETQPRGWPRRSLQAGDRCRRLERLPEAKPRFDSKVPSWTPSRQEANPANFAYRRPLLAWPDKGKTDVGQEPEHGTHAPAGRGFSQLIIHGTPN